MLVYRGVDNNTVETNSHIPYQPALLKIIYLYPTLGYVCSLEAMWTKKHSLVWWSLKIFESTESCIVFVGSGMVIWVHYCKKNISQQTHPSKPSATVQHWDAGRCSHIPGQPGCSVDLKKNSPWVWWTQQSGWWHVQWYQFEIEFTIFTTTLYISFHNFDKYQPFPNVKFSLQSSKKSTCPTWNVAQKTPATAGYHGVTPTASARCPPVLPRRRVQ